MYDHSYYNGFRQGSLRSAHIIVPLVLDWVSPTSVIDLGCGTGEWLAAFREAGVSEVLGVDGNHVERDQLVIPEDQFRTHNLVEYYSSQRRYDLAISLEVAEHLPAGAAGTLVASLADLAAVVLFSAAIPNQPGESHVNCQWPAYWADLFAERGYVGIDALRPRLWEDRRVDWWYRQNIVLYASEEALQSRPALKSMKDSRLGPPLPLVHPELYQEAHRNLVEWGADWESKYWDLWGRERSLAP